MLSMLVLVVICIIGAIITYLLLAGKVRCGGVFTAYGLITLLPLILMLVLPVAFLDILPLYQCVKSGFKEFGGSIPIFFIALEIVIISVFSLIRLNVFPLFSFSKDADRPRRLLVLASGKRLLNYSIYGNLLYSVVFLTGITYFISKNHTTIGHLLMHPGDVLGYILSAFFLMLFFPFMALPIWIYAIIGFIAATGLVILACIVLILSMNGTIRIFYASEKIRKTRFIYIVLLLFPIINLFCMIKLCKLADMELNICRN